MACQVTNTVEDHLTWMRVRGLRPATITQRRDALRRLEAALGCPLLTVTEEALYEWATRLRGSESNRSMNMMNAAQFFRWAWDTGLIEANPAVRLPRPKVRRGVPRPIAAPSLEMAIATAAPDVRCWLVLGAYAGLRGGEMSRLQRQDILDTAPNPVLVLDGKGGRQRIVPASPRVLFELRAYGLPTRGEVFRRRDGKPGAPTPARVSQLVGAHLRDLGLNDTGHAARHRFASDVYRISKDLRLTQELLGHANPSTTAIYAAFNAEEAAEVVRALV